MEDTRIIELYWLRDETAIGETDRKYGTRCRGIASDVLQSREDAEECVNDTYLAVWNAIPPQRPANFCAYICRVTRNLSLDRVRRALARKRGGGEAALVLDEIAPFVASRVSVERDYEAKELVAAVNAFLRTLSADDRVIFTARYWLMLPVAEIARRLGAKESRVTTSLHRSRKKLKRYLQEEELI